MKNITLYIITFTLFLITSAFAETYEVQMLNKLEKDRNVFNPSILHIKSGDTVKWISVDKGHNIASPDLIQWAPGLPKTRSGKIMRRILRKIAENDYSNLGDTSTLADPSVVDDLIDNRMNK